MSQIYYNPPVGQPGAPVRANGGGGIQAIGYRDVLDARRSVGDGMRVPSAEYPDGYLGTINARRGDRLMKSLKGRLSQREYQRGVHKGDRIDPGDYVWSGPIDPMAGLRAQAKGKKWAPQGNPIEKLAHSGKVAALSPEDVLQLQQQAGVNSNDSTQAVNPARKEAMRGLLPAWK